MRVTTAPMDQLLPALAVIAGILGTLFTFRNLPERTRKRSTLKADIEIYGLLDPADPKREVVKASINSSIDRLYHPEKSRRVWDPTSLVIGIFMTVGFGLWTAYLLRDGFSWWAVFTVSFVPVGVVGFVQAFEPPASPSTKQEETE
jgi:hypothetical protein